MGIRGRPGSPGQEGPIGQSLRPCAAAASTATHLGPASSLAVHPQGPLSRPHADLPGVLCSSPHDTGRPQAHAKPKCLCGAATWGRGTGPRWPTGCASCRPPLGCHGPGPRPRRATSSSAPQGCAHLAGGAEEAGRASSMPAHLGLCLCLTTCWQLEEVFTRI